MFSTNDYLLHHDDDDKLLIFRIKLTGPLRDSAALKEGDRAQAATLRLLRDNEDIMDQPEHNALHHKWDRYDGSGRRVPSPSHSVASRLPSKAGAMYARGKRRRALLHVRFDQERAKIKGRFIKLMTQWPIIESYRVGSVELTMTAATSSRKAISNSVWRRKGLSPELQSGNEGSSNSAGPSAESQATSDGTDYVAVLQVEGSDSAASTASSYQDIELRVMNENGAITGTVTLPNPFADPDANDAESSTTTA
ncbi:hypothetical protein DAEQUDRAFT_736573 [Daedalea quercina L-15889]|uniref:Uncharacterized protein n=1 Tax=Daedalea quercina L-15889 TaxID=1314783 RepID=A0A165SB14_9APHY|nr:hypothetical protein DAEQUDRAFT_736573 [Daedalea quercina L-15889]